VTENKLQTFYGGDKTFLIKDHRSSNHQFYEMYMRKIGQEHFIHVLGKNGEPQAEKRVQIVVRHKDFKGDVKS
jgi:hypothetical protein